MLSGDNCWSDDDSFTPVDMEELKSPVYTSNCYVTTFM